MARRASAEARRAAAAALAVALCVPAPVALAQQQQQQPAAVNARIAPKPGHPHTTFRVAFTAPQPAGHQGVTDRSYSVELAVRGKGCSQASVQTVPQAAAGARVHLRFGPPSGRWCLGKGKGTISMDQGPHCDRSTGDRPCPEFPSTTRQIAHFGFKVTRRA